MPRDTKQLVDGYGRVATDLRVSITDRCNLRCTYCMPEQGLDWLAKDSILTDDEVIRLISIGVEQLGITDVRFTGGEPLLRPSVVDLVARAASLPAAPRLAMTTNGIGLAKVANSLATAGLNRINVSLDTLRADRFKALTKRERLGEVFDGLDAARAAGLDPVKINSVLMRGINDDEAVALLQFAIENNYELRFIEQMPLDPMHQWSRENMVDAQNILTMLESEFTLLPVDQDRGAAPAELWQIEGTSSTVGIIGSVSRPFCGDCNRTRITADGMIRNCLFARREDDLRTLMREGASDEEIAQAWCNETRTKLPGHGINEPSFLQPQRPMSAIGG